MLASELRPFNIRVIQVTKELLAFANPERIERDEVHNKEHQKKLLTLLCFKWTTEDLFQNLVFGQAILFKL